jgi:hypothetical protein
MNIVTLNTSNLLVTYHKRLKHTQINLLTETCFITKKTVSNLVNKNVFFKLIQSSFEFEQTDGHNS